MALPADKRIELYEAEIECLQDPVHQGKYQAQIEALQEKIYRIKVYQLLRVEK